VVTLLSFNFERAICSWSSFCRARSRHFVKLGAVGGFIITHGADGASGGGVGMDVGAPDLLIYEWEWEWECIWE
jgi:hypothetical protein